MFSNHPIINKMAKYSNGKVFQGKNIQTGACNSNNAKIHSSSFFIIEQTVVLYREYHFIQSL